MSDYYLITSKLNDYVLDIKGAGAALKAPVISYPQNTPNGDNQLWTFVNENTSSNRKSAFA